MVSAWITWTLYLLYLLATPTRLLQCLCWWKTKCWKVCGSRLAGRRVMVFSARAAPPLTCMPWISHASSSSLRSKVRGCAVFLDLPSSHLHRWETFLKGCTYEDVKVKELLEFLSVIMMEWWLVCCFFSPEPLLCEERGWLSGHRNRQHHRGEREWWVGQRFITKAEDVASKRGKKQI